MPTTRAHTKIIVMTDVHANLPALQAALDAAAEEGYDEIVHTGDAIAIGPFPAECLDLLLSAGVTCTVGNHEDWFVHGLPTPRPEWLTKGEEAHQHWTHEQLEPHHREALQSWPTTITREIEGVRTVFTHYGMHPEGHGFKTPVRHAGASDLDEVFAGIQADAVFYGHEHAPSDVSGNAHYVNPGSLGCHVLAAARWCIATFSRGRVTVDFRSVPYGDAELFAAFERRRVPERAFICDVFLGGRHR